MTDWLTVRRGTAPLVIGLPHTGIGLLPEMEGALISSWRARRDTDWWVDELYDIADVLGATVVRTSWSRTVIDVNRDPSGASLYPGQATTGLCPVTTFDGEPLYRAGTEPDATETARRRTLYHAPYHVALAAEIARLRAVHPRVVLFDAHSIRSRIPRLFDGELPVFNVGTNDGQTCDAALTAEVVRILAATGQSTVVDGRFKGGWTTRHYGDPASGIHAVQLELAMRAYLVEPALPDATVWPAPVDAGRAAALRPVLRATLAACLAFAIGDRP